MLPIDSTDPREAIDSTLSCDHSDQRDDVGDHATAAAKGGHDSAEHDVRLADDVHRHGVADGGSAVAIDPRLQGHRLGAEQLELHQGVVAEVLGALDLRQLR